ncbi:MAG: CpaF family protein [Pirellulaceae bacterium]|nr:CpaF family protein [Pirellulaceae bacterium]
MGLSIFPFTKAADENHPLYHTDEAVFQRTKTELHQKMLESLDLSRIANMEEEELKGYITRIAKAVIDYRSSSIPGGIDRARLEKELVAESFGLGPLEPLLADPMVSDILVNGPHEVYVEKHGQLIETEVLFADEEHLMQTISRIVARVGRRIDENSPMVDARLPDGSRVNAIIPPLALNGPVLSIRRFGVSPLQMENLLLNGSICSEMVQLLSKAVEGKRNILVSGGTGAGKTTLLNNLSRYIPLGERLVTIEDSAELLLQRKHVVRLETRPSSADHKGEVSQRDLVKNALRMRPDRILVGEVRGAEALDMLQAMNTGHEGSLSTIHANSSNDALSRLEVMVSLAGAELPVSVVRRYIASAIDLVIQVDRLAGGRRHVMEIVEIVGLAGDEYHCRPIAGFSQQGLTNEGAAQGEFFFSGERPSFLGELKERGLELPDSLFAKRGIACNLSPSTVIDQGSAGKTVPIEGNITEKFGSETIVEGANSPTIDLHQDQTVDLDGSSSQKSHFDDDEDDSIFSMK